MALRSVASRKGNVSSESNMIGYVTRAVSIRGNAHQIPRQTMADEARGMRKPNHLAVDGR